MLPKSLSCTKGFSVAILKNCQKKKMFAFEEAPAVSYIALTLPSTEPCPSPVCSEHPGRAQQDEAPGREIHWQNVSI